MIHTQTFDTLAATLKHFNAPANAHLRLVSVLPPDGDTQFTALYDAPAAPRLASEEERLRVLDERIMTLWQLDDVDKLKLGIPQGVVAENALPLTLVNNKLRNYVGFRGLDTPTREAWVRDNLHAVRCSLLGKAESRAKYGCSVELIVIED